MCVSKHFATMYLGEQIVFGMSKRLYRSTTDRMIAGVCGGLGEYFDMDPVIWRIIFLVGLFADGASVVIYIIMAIVVPETGASTQASKEDAKKDTTPVVPESERNWMIGLVLLALGVVLLLKNLLPAFSMHLLWPILLIAAGLGVLLNGFKTK